MGTAAKPRFEAKIPDAASRRKRREVRKAEAGFVVDGQRLTIQCSWRVVYLTISRTLVSSPYVQTKAISDPTRPKKARCFHTKSVLA